MGTYPGADWTTEQLLDALSNQVEQQRSAFRNVKDRGFRSVVRSQRPSLRFRR